MNTIRFLTTTLFLVFATHMMAFGQSTDITKTFKKHFNETVQKVHQTESADEKRTILNKSLTKMMTAIDRIESRANLSEEGKAQLSSYEDGISEKYQELNGLNGFDKVMDKNLNDFSDYSQNYMEQADRTVTIGITTALLILIILLLL
jgi:predicted tellurium resistance membrane protein TerC